MKAAEFGTAWDAAVKECATAVAKPNIEDILSKTRYKLDAIGPDDVLLGLKKDKLVEFEKLIGETIAKVASPDASTIPKKLPHGTFAMWVKHCDTY